ncbi:DUF3859 domain-containing protein [Thalassotalea fonticola]|uniref:DUF3859 domain-containing protein n=1 Tax=Thalassotalea fonticola TaxID=3065649 RepID=A0ABZ0GR42_9GAMM|nr:DUF3859 domain-containing protein [Colwelliaceae bacterium S1-1]
MAKSKPEFSIKSYGIYELWNPKVKELPRIQNFTSEIPAVVDIEFGYILNVKKGKGCKLNFKISHPNILDKNGNVMAPFTGEVFVKTNDWSFFLGDTIWQPIQDKLGPWQIVIKYHEKIVADKTFNVVIKESDDIDEFTMLNKKINKRR